MGRIAAINKHKEKQKEQQKAVQQPPQAEEPIQTTEPPRVNLSEQIGTQQPLQQDNYDHPIDKVPDAEKMKQQMRSNAIQGMSYEDAMRQGNISPAEYVREMKAKAKAEGRELNGYETALAMLKADEEETPEQQEKRLKREKAGRIIDAIGTLGGSIANMYYASKGALPVQFSGKYADKAEAIRAKREALKDKEDALLRDARMGEIGWKRKKELADAEDERQLQRLLLNLNYRQAKDADDAAARDKEHKRRVARDKADAEAKKKELAEQQRYHRAKENGSSGGSLGGSGRSKRRIGFSDGKGNSVSINEQVWKGSMQQVFDILVEEGIGSKGLNEYVYNSRIAKMKTQDRDNFVKQNWNKSERAKKLMQELSTMDPENMQTAIKGDDEIIDWNPDDEIIDYVP